MHPLTSLFAELPEFSELMLKIKNKRTPCAVSGLAHVHRAGIAAAAIESLSRPALIVTPDEDAARRMAEDLLGFSGIQATVLPAREFMFHNIESASHGWEHQRIGALHRMMTDASGVTIAPVEALMSAAIPPQVLEEGAFTLACGEAYFLDNLLEQLTRAGYARSAAVEGPGQFAVRGDILDFYSPEAEYPVRAEFFGDELDSLSYFSIDSQRRGERIERALILPCREVLPHLGATDVKGLAKLLNKLAAANLTKRAELAKNLTRDAERLEQLGSLPAIDRYLSAVYPDKLYTALDYLPEDTLVFFSDSGRVREAAKAFTFRMGEDIKSLAEGGLIMPKLCACYIDYSEFIYNVEKQDVITLDTFLTQSDDLAPRSVVSILAKQLPSYGGSVETAAADIRSYLAQDYRVLVLTGGGERAQYMSEALLNEGVDAPAVEGETLPKHGQALCAEGALSAGFEFPALRLAVITEGQVMLRRRERAKKKSKKSSRERVKSYADLTVGDLVVHEHHGIGRFTGMERITVDGVEKDYIRIAFAGKDNLFVPATNLDLISKYIGGGAISEDVPVKLNKLGGTEWQKARARAKGAAQDLAKKLIELYAERRRLKGFAFPKDDELQRGFEASFEFDETDDQLRCVEEIKADMQAGYPMDRLLCGDVGFGKTEVAFRAIMKCILGGKQAAILVPTTVLARQHFLTAHRRFSGYPLKIDTLSRFRTPKQQEDVTRRLLRGEIDVVVGTHRMLQKDVKFKDLGLLVIDEEQRFGVTHKERLREMARQVDTLTLTATPIPRTLNMALSGIRDMSVIEEPPRDRHPVQSYVLEHDMMVLIDAMRRELARGGQVYYLHNRIETIEQAAGKIRRGLPDAEIAVAHGRMNQQELGDIMTRMADGEIDILVCTTIIETGIDIPNVNTLIVEDADHLGLSQLHQIRGRVGRSSRHAYAYFTYRQGKILTEIAQKRLAAICEFTEFGSGFKIAMRDLEIRGAGNVLGPEQSGHMMSVGYDLYLKLLEEAVLTERGETAPQRVECAADLAVSANIPPKYISDAGERVDVYRRIAMISTSEDREDILDELIDRYGDPPKPVIALLDIAMLRSAASRNGICEIAQKEGKLLVRFEKPDFRRVSALCAVPKYKGRLLLNAGEKPYISLRLKAGEQALRLASQVVADYAAADNAGTQA